MVERNYKCKREPTMVEKLEKRNLEKKELTMIENWKTKRNPIVIERNYLSKRIPKKLQLQFNHKTTLFFNTIYLHSNIINPHSIRTEPKIRRVFKLIKHNPLKR